MTDQFLQTKVEAAGADYSERQDFENPYTAGAAGYALELDLDQIDTLVKNVSAKKRSSGINFGFTEGVTNFLAGATAERISTQFDVPSAALRAYAESDPPALGDKMSLADKFQYAFAVRAGESAAKQQRGEGLAVGDTLPFKAALAAIDVAANEIGGDDVDVRLLNAAKVLDKTKLTALKKAGVSDIDPESYAAQVGAAGVHMLNSIGLTAMSKNPSLAASYMATITASKEYNNSRQQGNSVSDSLAVASRTAAATSAIEAIGGRLWADTVLKSPEVKDIASEIVEQAAAKILQAETAKSIAKRTLGQAAEEATQDTAAKLVKEDVGVERFTLEEYVEDAVASILVALPLGATFSTAAAIAERKAAKYALGEQRPKAVEAVIEKYNDIVDSAAEIMYKETSPLAVSEDTLKEVAVKINQTIADAEEKRNAPKPAATPKTLEQLETELSGERTPETKTALAELQAVKAVAEAELQEILAKVDAKIPAMEAKIFERVVKQLQQRMSVLQTELRNTSKLRAVAKQEQRLEAVKKEINTLAELAEAVDREGGIQPADPRVLRKLAALRDEKRALESEIRKSEKFRKAKDVLAEMGQVQNKLDALLVEREPVSDREQAGTAGDLRRAVIDNAKTARMALRKGARIARDNALEGQKILLETLNSYSIDAKDREKFIRRILAAGTPERAARLVEAMEIRLLEVETARTIRATRSRIKQLLKKTKAKTDKSGKKVGKYTAEVQEVLDTLRSILSLTQEQAEAKWMQKVDALAEVFGLSLPSAKDRIELAMLEAQANGAKSDLDVLLGIEIGLEDLIATGTADRLLQKTALEQQKEAKIQEFLALAEPKGDVIREPRSNPTTGLLDLFGVLRQRLLTTMTTKDKDAAEAFVDSMSTFQAARDYDEGILLKTKELYENLMRSTGLSKKKLAKKLTRDAGEEIELGTFTLKGRSKPERIVMSRAELQKRWMELQNEKGRYALTEEKGNGYTDAVIEAIDNEMTTEDRAIANGLFAFFDNYYPRVNEVYRRLHGLNLGKEQFYSALSRQVAQEAETSFLQGLHVFSTMTPKAIRERKGGAIPLRLRGSLESTMSYIYEMEYFIAYAEQVGFMQSVLKDRRVQDAIRQNSGEDAVIAINRDVDYLAKKSAMTAEIKAKFVEVLYRNFQAAQLMLKPQIGLKQFVAFPLFMEGVSTKDFVKGIADFAANPKKAYNIMKQSQFYRNRGDDFDRDLQSLIQEKHFLNALQKLPTLRKMLFFNITYGDRATILLGGYAHYSAQRAKGMNHEQALESFAKVANRTQQSRDPETLSPLQRTNNPIGRILTMFTSGAINATRVEYEAALNLIRGRGSRADAAKMLFVTHLLVPNLYTLIANGFEIEEEDHLIASILGSLNTIYIVGDALEALAMEAVKGDFFDSKVRHPIQALEDLIKAMRKADDITWEDFVEGSKELDKLLNSVGGLTGIPLATGVRMAQGIVKIAEGEDVEQGVYEALGYSRYTIDKINDDEE